MADWMDELLGRLPGEAPPVDLVASIESRLRFERRRSLWTGRLTSIAAVAAAALGAWLMAPTVQGLQVSTPAISLEGLSAGLSFAFASPYSAAWQGMAEALVWIGRALGSMESGVMLSLALLAAPACWGAIRLLSEEGRKQGWTG
jgi:hypothetical protein